MHSHHYRRNRFILFLIALIVVGLIVSVYVTRCKPVPPTPQPTATLVRPTATLKPKPTSTPTTVPTKIIPTATNEPTKVIPTNTKVPPTIVPTATLVPTATPTMYPFINHPLHPRCWPGIIYLFHPEWNPCK